MSSSMPLGDQKVVMEINIRNCFKSRGFRVFVLDNHAQKGVFLYAISQWLNKRLGRGYVGVFLANLIKACNYKGVVETDIFPTDCAAFIRT